MKKEMAVPSRAAFEVDLKNDDRADAAAAQAAKWIATFMYCHGFASLESTSEKFQRHSTWRST
jgi:hypothetical protein